MDIFPVIVQRSDKPAHGISRRSIICLDPVFEDQIAIPERELGLTDFFAQPAVQALKGRIHVGAFQLHAVHHFFCQAQFGPSGCQFVFGDMVSRADRYTGTAGCAALYALAEEIFSLLGLSSGDIPAFSRFGCEKAGYQSDDRGEKMGQGENPFEGKGAHEQSGDAEKPSFELEKFVGIEHFIGIHHSLFFLEFIQFVFFILAFHEGGVPYSQAVWMALTAHCQPDEELVEEQTQNIVEFFGVVAIERQDDQMGKILFFTTQDDFYRGLYVEIPSQFSGSPDKTRQHFCGYHHLSS
jgi:hypothetical protein